MRMGEQAYDTILEVTRIVIAKLRLPCCRIRG